MKIVINYAALLYGIFDIDLHRTKIAKIAHVRRLGDYTSEALTQRN